MEYPPNFYWHINSRAILFCINTSEYSLLCANVIEQQNTNVTYKSFDSKKRKSLKLFNFCDNMQCFPQKLLEGEGGGGKSGGGGQCKEIRKREKERKEIKEGKKGEKEREIGNKKKRRERKGEKRERKEEKRIWRKFAKLRMQLFHYLYLQAMQSADALHKVHMP